MDYGSPPMANFLNTADILVWDPEPLRISTEKWYPKPNQINLSSRMINELLKLDVPVCDSQAPFVSPILDAETFSSEITVPEYGMMNKLKTSLNRVIRNTAKLYRMDT